MSSHRVFDDVAIALKSHLAGRPRFAIANDHKDELRIRYAPRAEVVVRLHGDDAARGSMTWARDEHEQDDPTVFVVRRDGASAFQLSWNSEAAHGGMTVDAIADSILETLQTQADLDTRA